MVEQISHKYKLTIPETGEGTRVDKFLSSALTELSRTRLKSLIEEGQVTLGGVKLTSPSHRVKSGDELNIEIPVPRPPLPKGQAIALNIQFEDDDLIVLEKPPGLVVHPAPGNPDRTLVNALIAHCGSSLSGIGGETRPGIVHRLDKDTSGLMLAAKNDYSHRHLAAQFADHTLDRAYLALVWGVVSPNQGDISGNIGRNPGNRKKMAVVPYGGKTALTSYKLQKTLGDWASLVECRLATGRTHQIRVHMASFGHSVIGDNLYGGGIKSAIKKRAPEFSERAAKLDRHALHAYLLGFIHPRTGKRLRFEIKLAKDIKALL
ncbi:RluA family pseudouridine synthase [Rhodospirillales bacterium]|nr:RluA family pseudouridine synthase [Rhodospirillales bacterium]